MNSTFHAISEDVVSKTLDGEEVLLNLESGSYFGLNEIGTLIWKGLQTNSSSDSIIADLVEKFEVTAEQAQADYFAFVAQLQEKKLIR